MYSPTTRLLTLLELLQSYKAMSGTEIARRLEVDKRTVRRYITMLQDMGIPVEAERGPYGAYQLRPGFKLPPLMFTDAEAVAVTLGLLAIREFRFPVDVAAVEGALAKTERVMPATLLSQIRGLQESITFNVSLPSNLPHPHILSALSEAAQQHQQVSISYETWSGEKTERDFDPYGIVFNDGYWYTAGYCHLRQDLRTFRLDRISKLEPRKTSFTAPENFDVLDYVLKSVTMMPGTRQVEAVLDTTLEQAQQLIPPIMGTLEVIEDGVLFRRSITQLDWVALYLMTLDVPITIRQPEELREMIRQMAARGLKMVDNGPPD